MNARARFTLLAAAVVGILVVPSVVYAATRNAVSSNMAAGTSQTVTCAGPQLQIDPSSAVKATLICTANPVTTTTTAPVTTTAPPTTTTPPTTTGPTTTVAPVTTTTAPSGPTTTVPAGSLPFGVTLTAIDGGQAYYAQWPNAFPSGLYPIGVFPFEASPASLSAVGVNYGTPMRNDNAGTWSPVYTCSGCVNSQTAVNAQAGFYSGGDYEGAGSPAWGSKAVFNVFGDELDGQCGNGLFDNNPANVRSAASECGSWGGTSAAGLEAANAATKSNDPSRPVYDQFTVTFTGLTQDGSYGSQYSNADQSAVCASTDILSFDLYPVVKRGEPVYDTYNDVAQMRSMCGDARPVFPFIEMDHMDGANIYPTPAQTTAEVWNAIIAGAGGVQYFDQYGDLTDSSYTGGGTYAAGAMYQAIKTTDAQIAALTPVLQSPTASGFVTSTGNVKTMVKYSDGHFYLFAVPHTSTAQTVTFTVPSQFTTATGLDGTSDATISGGKLSVDFASATDIHMWEIS